MSFKIYPYQVTENLKQAEQEASRFDRVAKQHRTLVRERNAIMEQIGNRSWWWVFILPVIGAMVVFAVFLPDLLSDLAGNMQPLAIIFIGAFIAIVGLSLGYALNENIQHHPQTGLRQTDRYFWGSIVAGMIYIAVLTVLGWTAEPERIDGNGSKMLLFTTGSALMVISMGFLLKKPFDNARIFWLNVRLWFITRRVYKCARNCTNAYREYLMLIEAYNQENPGKQMQPEGNRLIRNSMAFYLGEEPNSGGNSRGNSPEQTGPNPATPDIGSSNGRGPDRRDGDGDSGPDLGSFLDDRIDDDLRL